MTSVGAAGAPAARRPLNALRRTELEWRQRAKVARDVERWGSEFSLLVADASRSGAVLIQVQRNSADCAPEWADDRGSNGVGCDASGEDVCPRDIARSLRA